MIEYIHSELKIYYGTLDLQVYGSFPAGLSTKDSDLDLRLVIPKSSLNRENSPILSFLAHKFENGHRRLKIIDHIKFARVPVLILYDKPTGISIDLTTGSEISPIIERHIKICQRTLDLYPKFLEIYHLMKIYLKKCNWDSVRTGGINSFILFYMILAFYQNYQTLCQRDGELENFPDVINFLEFYTIFDQAKFGLRIDLSRHFPLENL